MDSDFKQHLERHGIKPILAKVKHPQTNGKLEGYIVRPSLHLKSLLIGPLRSPDFERLETPERVFRRKMKPEMHFAIGHRLFGL